MGGVVTCPEKYAAEAGREMFKLGGNAMDAAAATAIAQAVTNPMLVGIGGGGQLNAFHAGRDRHEIIYFGGVAGANANPDCYRYLGKTGKVTGYKVENDENEIGHKASMVPGFFRGLHTGLLRHGSGHVTWEDVVRPAFHFANDGFEVDEYVYQFWKPGGVTGSMDIGAVLQATPECARIFLKDGRVYEPGDLLIQKDMAWVLDKVARNGPEEFYTGEIGRMIAEDFANHDALVTADDLASYQPLIQHPIRTTYRGFEITTDPPPACGVLVVEMLNILELHNVRGLGWNTPACLDLLARTMYLVFHDRARFMGDPRLVDVPQERLISKAYASELAGMIERGEDLKLDPHGDVSRDGTTHVSSMDDEGNAVAMTHSNGMGSGAVTPGLGFIHNNHMLMFDPLPGQRNSIAPGKLPVTGGSPTLVFKDGQVVLAVGSPAGARKATGIVQTIVNIIDFGMGAQDAVSVKRIHAEDEPGQVIVEPDMHPEVIAGLEKLGRSIETSPYTARMAIVYRDPVTGQIEGGTDPRGGGGIAVYP
jgi:gamma-glutamyltranspeptidase/glutathione hydrolase